MFGYIVQRINEMLSPELTQLKRASTLAAPFVACLLACLYGNAWYGCSLLIPCVYRGSTRGGST